MKNGLHIRKDKVAQVLRGLSRVPERDVLVGIPQENSTRSKDAEDNGDLTNAEIGYINDHGAPDANIPPRPFLLPGVREATPRIIPHLKAAARLAMDGKTVESEKELHRAGLIGASAVQAKITHGPFVALAPSTIKRRRRRGRTGIKPLFDTGQLRRSVTHVVRNKVK